MLDTEDIYYASTIELSVKPLFVRMSNEWLQRAHNALDVEKRLFSNFNGY